MSDYQPESQGVIAMENRHRIRRVAATLVGGIGILFFTLAFAVMAIFGNVSSAQATQKTVESVIADPAVRQRVASELVTKIEESGDKPQDKIVFSVARPLIENAVAKALDTPKIQQYVGGISFTMYEVFVEEKPATQVDLSPIVDAGVGAIKKVDKRVAKDLAPKVEPLEVKRDVDSPDLRTIRDDVTRGLWVVLLLGISLLVLSWFLAPATNIQKLMRLGIRAAIGGLVVVLTVFATRGQSFGVSEEDVDAVQAVTQQMSGAANIRGFGLLIVGSVIVVCCYLKTSSSKKKLLQP